MWRALEAATKSWSLQRMPQTKQGHGAIRACMGLVEIAAPSLWPGTGQLSEARQAPTSCPGVSKNVTWLTPSSTATSQV